MGTAQDRPDPSTPRLEADERARIAAALRYMGRDLQHRSFAVNAERRELLWGEMDRCLALAERLEPVEPPPAGPSPEATTACTLITGASSGIGAALARRMAADLAPAAAGPAGGRDGDKAAGPDACLVLTARRLERLEALTGELEARHGVHVVPIAADLARPGGARDLLAELGHRGLAVRTLVNNAGFGLRGAFDALAWEEAEAMLQLMVVGPAELCHGVLPGMRRAGGGRIVAIASLAGLVPGLPGSTLYSACKAFLIRFSQSLALETRRDGVRVMVVCPGYVRTEFHAVLGVEERMERLPGLLWMDADLLARRTLEALEGDRVVIVPGAVNQAIAALARWLPEGAATALSSTFSRRYRQP
jgi:short-subunit dehydrogenase